jgi:hypothetical protein
MIPAADLSTLAGVRLEDARALMQSARYDAAAYVAGYSVEIALKARICHTLNWRGFPETAHEFKGLQSLKTHDLDILLQFSGIEAQVRAAALDDWLKIVTWRPEWRYQTTGTFSEGTTATIIAAAGRLLAVI